jgi:hypothetical protein
MDPTGSSTWMKNYAFGGPKSELLVTVLFTHTSSEIVLTHSIVCLTIHLNEASEDEIYHSKVVFNTGASDCMGQETAITHGKAGQGVG